MVEARPVGARVDVNASTQATLAQLFRHIGMRPGRADSAAAAVASHKPYVDLRQVHLVPGLDSVAALDSVLDVEPGPISLNHAPGAVLTLLPGFTDETVERVLEARARDAPVSTFYELAQLLSPDAPDASARLPGVAVFQPAAWVITTRATTGRPPVTVALEVRLARWSRSTAISRRRSWIE
jgi:type II secretory pathway component PulK